MANILTNAQIFKYSLIGFFVFLLAIPALAQYNTNDKKAAKLFDQAIRFYGQNNYTEAQNLLEKALNRDPNFIEALSLMGDLNALAKDYDEAARYYQKIVEVNSNAFPKAYYYLAGIYQKKGDHEKAFEYINQFLSYRNVPRPLKDKAEDMRKHMYFAKEAVKNPVPFKPINLGAGVNSEHQEFHPSLSLDHKRLIFTRDEPYPIPINGKTVNREDFYESIWDGEKWGLAKNLGAPLNTPDNEGAQFLTHDGKWLFFTACYREDGIGKCDIYLAEKRGDKWSKALNLGKPVNTANWEAQPSFSPDGKTLFFVSTRSGGKGGADIWSAELQKDGSFANLKNLPFNTDKNEYSPFIHSDGKTLYFASNGLPGMGGFDLFRVSIDDNGDFGKPINLGYPINTEKDEHGMIVERSGEYAYYASDRDSGYGGLDLYRFELAEHLRPNPVGLALGRVIDAETKLPLLASFELINLNTGNPKVKSRTNKLNGEFLIPLPQDELFVVNVSADGYLFYSDEISIQSTEINEVQTFEILLQPLKIGSKMVLNNIFFETGKFGLKLESRAELNKLIDFMEANEKVAIKILGHTDNVGNASSNLELSEQRAKAVYDYLKNHGIAAQRLAYKGFGSAIPIADNQTEAGRQKNRRTEFEITAY